MATPEPSVLVATANPSRPISDHSIQMIFSLSMAALVLGILEFFLRQVLAQLVAPLTSHSRSWYPMMKAVNLAVRLRVLLMGPQCIQRLVLVCRHQTIHHPNTQVRHRPKLEVGEIAQTASEHP